MRLEDSTLEETSMNKNPTRNRIPTRTVGVGFRWLAGLTLAAMLVACPPTKTDDTDPDAASMVFALKDNQVVNTDVDSNEVTPTGYNATTTVTVLGGKYSINGGAFTNANGTISPGQKIKLQGRSATTENATSSVMLQIGATPSTFTIKTGSVTPSNGDFTPVTDANLSTVYESNAQTLEGLGLPTSISVIGGQYSIDGGATYKATADTVQNGTVVQVRGTSSASLNTLSKVQLRVGSKTLAFEITTRGNSDASNFTSQTGLNWNQLTESNEITLSNINPATPIAITNGEYRITSGAAVGTYTSVPGTVNAGDKVQVRGTTASNDNTAVNVTLTLGSGPGAMTRSFTITTGKRIPDAFSLADAPNAVPGSSVARTFSVSGITILSPITVTNASFTVNGTPRTSPSTVSNNDTVVVTATAPATVGSSITATVTVGRDALNPSGGRVVSFTVTAVSPGTGGIAFNDQTGVAPNASEAELEWNGSDGCNGIYPPATGGPCDGLSGDPRYLRPLPPANPSYTLSNTVTVGTISPNTPITIVGGQYRKNGGTFTSAPGTISTGDTLQLRLNAIIPGALNKATLTVGTGGSAFTRDFNVTTTAGTFKNVWTPNAVTTPVPVPSSSTVNSTITVPTTSAKVAKVRVLVTLSSTALQRSDMIFRLISPSGTTLTLMDFVSNKTTVVGSTADCKTYLPAGRNPLDPRNAPSCYPPNTPVSVPLATGTVMQSPWPWNFLNYSQADGGWGGAVDTIFDSSNFGTNGAAGSSAGIYDVGAGIDTYLDGGIIRNDVYRRCGSDFYIYSAKKFNSDPNGDANLNLQAGQTPSQVTALNTATNRTLPRAGAIDPYTGKADGRAEGRLGKFLGEYFEGQCKRRDGDTFYPPVAPDPRIGNLTSLNGSNPSGTWTLQVVNAGAASSGVTITAFKLIFDFTP